MMKRILGISAAAMLAWTPISKVEINFKLTKGKVYEQTVESQTNVKQEAMGQTIEINTISKVKTALEVMEEKAEGNVYNVWYKGMEMEFNGMGQEQRFCSDTTLLTAVDPMSEVLSKVTNKKFQATIARQGSVTDISGLELIISSATKSEMGVEAQGDLAKQLLQSYGNEGLKSSLESFTDIFPGKSVKEGESWSKTQTLNAGMPVISKTTYTLKEIRGTEVQIDIEGTLEVDPANARSNLNGMDATYFVEGTRKGSLLVEISTGWVKAGTLSDDLEGSITLIPDPSMTEGIVVPMKVSTTTSFSGN
jgi:hypothetical protein